MIPTDFLQDALQRYCEQHSEALPYYLTEIERRTHRTTLAPQMISGHLQGRLLSLLSRLRRPRCIVEIGTFTGYSAVCLSEGLSSEGILHTIDIDDQYQPFYDYIREQVPKSHQIKFHSGDALEIIPQLQGPFDLVFIDGAKKDYLRYFEIITERCSQAACSSLTMSFGQARCSMHRPTRILRCSRNITKCCSTTRTGMSLSFLSGTAYL